MPSGGENQLCITESVVSNKRYVIKTPLRNGPALRSFENECCFYANDLKHPFILNALTIRNDTEKKYLILPYCPKGDVFSLLEDHALSKAVQPALVMK